MTPPDAPKASVAERAIDPVAYQCGRYEVVDRFGAVMKQKLSENSGEGGWDHCEQGYLMRRTRTELREVVRLLRLRARRTLTSDEQRELARECAGLANCALMIADNFGDMRAAGLPADLSRTDPASTEE